MADAWGHQATKEASGVPPAGACSSRMRLGRQRLQVLQAQVYPLLRLQVQQHLIAAQTFSIALPSHPRVCINLSVVVARCGQRHGHLMGNLWRPPSMVATAISCRSGVPTMVTWSLPIAAIAILWLHSPG